MSRAIPAQDYFLNFNLDHWGCFIPIKGGWHWVSSTSHGWISVALLCNLSISLCTHATFVINHILFDSPHLDESVSNFVFYSELSECSQLPESGKTWSLLYPYSFRRSLTAVRFSQMNRSLLNFKSDFDSYRTLSDVAKFPNLVWTLTRNRRLPNAVGCSQMTSILSGLEPEIDTYRTLSDVAKLNWSCLDFNQKLTLTELCRMLSN